MSEKIVVKEQTKRCVIQPEYQPLDKIEHRHDTFDHYGRQNRDFLQIVYTNGYTKIDIIIRSQQYHVVRFYRFGFERKLSLTDNGQVVPETLGGGIPEIHTAPVHPFIVPAHFVHEETSRIIVRLEGGTVTKHFRCRIMTCLFQRHPSDIETANTIRYSIAFETFCVIFNYN